jgi:hypothetical protein
MPRVAIVKTSAKAKKMVAAPKGASKAQAKRAAEPGDDQPPAKRGRPLAVPNSPAAAAAAESPLAASPPEAMADGMIDLMTLKGGAYVNANIWEEVDRNLATISAAVPGLVQMDAPKLQDDDSEQEGSGFEVMAVGIQASFNTKAFRRSIRSNREYKCAQNFFRHAMTWTSAPAVLNLDYR